MGSFGLRPVPSKGEAGFGLVGIVISLMIIAILSVGALKAFASGAGSGSGSPAQNPAVNQAYDVQAQSALSNAMGNVRDGAISNGGVSASDLRAVRGVGGALDVTLGGERCRGALERRGSDRVRQCDAGGRVAVENVLVRVVLVVGHLVRLGARRLFMRRPTDARGPHARCRIAGLGRLAAGLVPRLGITTPEDGLGCGSSRTEPTPGARPGIPRALRWTGQRRQAEGGATP